MVLVWLDLWCLTPFSTIFQLFRDGQLYWWSKPKNTNDLSQVTDRLYQIIMHRVHTTMNGIRTHNFSGKKALVAQRVVNQTTIKSRSRRPPILYSVEC